MMGDSFFEEYELIKAARHASPNFATLKKFKVPLSAAERQLVMARKAVWHFHGYGTTPAVWKSVVRGKPWYVTNTHRAFNVRPTLLGAINRYHRFIKGTA